MSRGEYNFLSPHFNVFKSKTLNSPFCFSSNLNIPFHASCNVTVWSQCAWQIAQSSEYT